jgi:Cu(I)/Ag(I) efflux system membrane protein CusA/SilA
MPWRRRRFLSVTLVPVLMLWFVRGKIKREEENIINRFFIGLYKPAAECGAEISQDDGAAGIASLLISTALPVSSTGIGIHAAAV